MLSKLLSTLILVFPSLAVMSSAPEVQAATIALEPATVSISAFYNGGDIDVSGQVPADADVLVRVSGEPHEVTLKKKGKVSGLLWMNVADVTFENVPPVYLLYTSKGFLGSVDDSATGGMWGELGLGFDAIKEQMQIQPSGEDKDTDFKDFLKLKQREHLYSLMPDSVRFVDSQGSMKTFDAKIHLPTRLKQGTYKVDVLAVNGDQIVDTASEELQIKQIGFPAFLTTMAFDRALLYGILAVACALIAGLGMSIIFKDKGGAH